MGPVRSADSVKGRVSDRRLSVRIVDSMGIVVSSEFVRPAVGAEAEQHDLIWPRQSDQASGSLAAQIPPAWIACHTKQDLESLCFILNTSIDGTFLFLFKKIPLLY